MVPRPMDIGEFVDLVHRNAYRPDIRFIAAGAHSKRQGAPANTCTLLVGAWTPAIRSNEDTTAVLDRDHRLAINVPVPQIPEYTVIDPKTQRIVARGWKGLFEILLTERVVRPSSEIKRVLGDDFEHIRRKGDLGCC